MLHLVLGGDVGELVRLQFLVEHEFQHQMLVDFGVFLVAVPGQGVTHVLHLLLPPAHLLPGDLVLVGSPVELG